MRPFPQLVCCLAVLAALGSGLEIDDEVLGHIEDTPDLGPPGRGLFHGVESWLDIKDDFGRTASDFGDANSAPQVAHAF